MCNNRNYLLYSFRYIMKQTVENKNLRVENRSGIRSSWTLKTLLAAVCLGSMTYGLSSCSSNKSGDADKQGANTESLEGFDKVPMKGKEVATGAFAGNANLKRIRVPENITVIRTEAFSKCPNLKEVVLPDGLQSIDVRGFADCPALESVTFPKGLKIICDQSFENCPSLKKVALPEKCYCIGISAFEGASNLTDIEFTPALELVYERAFANCTSLKQVLMPATVQKVDTSAFRGCTNVEELAIPQALRYNIFEMFRDAKNLKKLYVLSLEPYNFPKANPIAGFPNKECSVYVPDAQVEDYRARATWAGFKEILPLSESGLYDSMGLRK